MRASLVENNQMYEWEKQFNIDNSSSLSITALGVNPAGTNMLVIATQSDQLAHYLFSIDPATAELTTSNSMKFTYSTPFVTTANTIYKTNSWDVWVGLNFIQEERMVYYRMNSDDID